MRYIDKQIISLSDINNDMTVFNSEVGKNLARCRKAAGYTQKQASAALNMSQPNYSRFERGLYELSYIQLATLCKLFECSADEILGIKN